MKKLTFHEWVDRIEGYWYGFCAILLLPLYFMAATIGFVIAMIWSCFKCGWRKVRKIENSYAIYLRKVN